MAVLLAAGVAASCSLPTEGLPRPGSCDPFQVTAVAPTPDSRDVSPDVAPAVTFSDFPDPDTVDASTLLLFTGPYYHTGRYWVDLVERRALFKPAGQLTAGLGYTFVVQPGVRSLRGCRLQAADEELGGSRPDAHAYRFQVAAPASERPPEPEQPQQAGYAQVVGIFAQHCAGASCHVGVDPAERGDGGCLPDPGGGLSLCDPDAHDALVGVPSRQVVRLVLVAPRDSSRSYLLRKLIGAPPVVGHSGVPGADLSREERHAIQDWIDTGARGASAAEASDGGL